MFEIDHQPWSNQQVLLTETLYDLNAKVTISAWPAKSDYLVIDYISSLAPEQYRITKLRIDRPRNANATEFAPTGHVEFPIAQNLFSEPIVIRVRATFLSTIDEHWQAPTSIVGYHQLRVLVTDKTRTTMPTRYKAIDARTLAIVNEIRQTLSQIDPQHLNDFTDALASIANFMGINLQQSRYKEGMKISEADFQKDVLYHLRMWSGEDVQEAPKQAGGPTDIKFKTIAIELKVEERISDRRKMIEKYCSQVAQYSSGSGAQLGILCILDLTEKHNPPANPQSQISLETPTVHGFPGGSTPFPIKIAAVIIDGNLRLPRSYSH